MFVWRTAIRESLDLLIPQCSPMSVCRSESFANPGLVAAAPFSCPAICLFGVSMVAWSVCCGSLPGFLRFASVKGLSLRSACQWPVDRCMLACHGIGIDAHTHTHRMCVCPLHNRFVPSLDIFVARRKKHNPFRYVVIWWSFVLFCPDEVSTPRCASKEKSKALGVCQLQRAHDHQKTSTPSMIGFQGLLGMEKRSRGSSMEAIHGSCGNLHTHPSRGAGHPICRAG
jgi:hypothetical protein